MKKAFGVLLILLGALLTLAILFGSLPLMIKETPRILKEQTAGYLGYFLGFFIGLALFGTLNFALYFFGIRLLKNKKKAPLIIPDKDFPSQLR